MTKNQCAQQIILFTQRPDQFRNPFVGARAIRAYDCKLHSIEWHTRRKVRTNLQLEGQRPHLIRTIADNFRERYDAAYRTLNQIDLA